jgi:hypothetical protein
MRELISDVVEVNGSSATNGHHDTSEIELQNGEFSADDEEVLDGVARKDNLEDEQPSLDVRPSVTPTPPTKDTKRISNRSASKTSSIAKAKASLLEVRQRFTGK